MKFAKSFSKKPSYRRKSKNHKPHKVSKKFTPTNRAFRDQNTYLRSINDLAEYGVYSGAIKIGSIKDLLFDASVWSIQYLVIELFNTPGKKILIAPSWIESIQWREAAIYIGIKYPNVLQAPEFDPSTSFTQRHEDQLYDYYGLTKY